MLVVRLSDMLWLLWFLSSVLFVQAVGGIENGTLQNWNYRRFMAYELAMIKTYPYLATV